MGSPLASSYVRQLSSSSPLSLRDFPSHHTQPGQSADLAEILAVSFCVCGQLGVVQVKDEFHDRRAICEEGTSGQGHDERWMPEPFGQPCAFSSDNLCCISFSTWCLTLREFRRATTDRHPIQRSVEYVDASAMSSAAKDIRIRLLVSICPCFHGAAVTLSPTIATIALSAPVGSGEPRQPRR